MALIVPYAVLEYMMRTFTTGATRDSDSEKPDYEGFLSPLVLSRYAKYMHEHRQTPGGLRDSDNWQRGIPRAAYAKSLWRHFMDFFLLHRGYRSESGADLQEALCALLFNAMGYLHEILGEEASLANLLTQLEQVDTIPSEACG